VELVDVARERFAILHVGHLEWHLTQIRLQVHPAVFAGQNISQIQNEIPVVVLILLSWIHRIVEAHGVQIVPHWRTPYCREHTIAGIIIFPCEYSGRFSILSCPLCHIHIGRKYLGQTLDQIKILGMCMEQTFSDLKTTQTMYMCFFAAIILILCAAFLPQTKATMYMNIFSILILLCVVYLNIKQTLDLQKANSEIGEQPDHIRTQINMNIVYSYFFTFSLGLLIVFVIRNMLTTF
jgi:hypothetical protein